MCWYLAALSLVSLDHSDLLLLIPPQSVCSLHTRITSLGLPAAELGLCKVASPGNSSGSLKENLCQLSTLLSHEIPFAFAQPAVLQTTLLSQFAEASFLLDLLPAFCPGCLHEPPLHQVLWAVFFQTAALSSSASCAWAGKLPLLCAVL